MPVEEGMIVSFKGDSSSLERSAKSAANSLESVESAAEQTSNALKGQERAAKEAATSLNQIPNVSRQIAAAAAQLARTTDQAGGSLRNVSAGGGRATEALTNLSRVAQDAPYGFIGIANNLNPLVESFGRLKAETGSTGGALKALVGSLSGAGGVGLALGVVTAAISFAQLGLSAWTRGMGEGKDSAEQLAGALEEVARQSEQTKDRLDAMLGSLDFSNRIGGLQVEIAGGDRSDVLKKELDRTKDAIKEAREEYQREFDRNIFTELNYSSLSGEAKKKADEAVKAYNDGLEQLGKKKFDLELKEPILKLEIDKAIQDELKKKEKSIKKPKEFKFPALVQLRLKVLDDFDLNADLKETAASIKAQLEKRNEVSEAVKTVLTDKLSRIVIKPRINIAPDIRLNPDSVIAFDLAKKVGDKLFANAEGIKARATQFADSVSAAVSQAMQAIGATVFTSIGEGIAAAATGGDVGAVFKNMFASIGDVIQQLGVNLIKLSPMIAALKASISSLSPAGLLAAGVGLVALGGIIKNSIKPKAFAHGGMVFGPTLGLVGEGRGTSASNPEVIAPLDKLKDFINPNGGSFPAYLPMHSISGTELRLWYARANKEGQWM